MTSLLHFWMSVWLVKKSFLHSESWLLLLELPSLPCLSPDHLFLDSQAVSCYSNHAISAFTLANGSSWSRDWAGRARLDTVSATYGIILRWALDSLRQRGTVQVFGESQSLGPYDSVSVCISCVMFTWVEGACSLAVSGRLRSWASFSSPFLPSLWQKGPSRWVHGWERATAIDVGVWTCSQRRP